MFSLEKITRKNIRLLTPYSSARDEYKGTDATFLDANESPAATINILGSPKLNRYPDPLQLRIKKKIASQKKLSFENIFLGNGSDEAIDILVRAFCEPARDNVIICPPTYGMYEVSANINNVKVITVPLQAETFALDIPSILKVIDKNSRIIFLCSPNNPTGNSVAKNDVLKLLKIFPGIVIVDEAYIDFSKEKSAISLLKKNPNLVVLQTFSKAWGLAGLRLGLAFADKKIISVLNKIKPPYNVNALTQYYALRAIDRKSAVEERRRDIAKERKLLSTGLKKLSFTLNIYPSDANFLLVKFTNAEDIYKFLVRKKIIVRDRSTVKLCEGCLRITVGSNKENKRLINALKQYK